MCKDVAGEYATLLTTREGVFSLPEVETVAAREWLPSGWESRAADVAAVVAVEEAVGVVG